MALSIPYLNPISAEGEPLAMPAVYFDDFTDGWGSEANDADNTGKFSETANLGQWLVTVVDDNPDNGEVVAVADDAVGGQLTLTTNDADNDALNLQINGEAWQAASGKTLIFEIRMKGTDVSEFDWFVGLAVADTDVLGGVTDRIGFECPDSTGDIDAVCEKDSTQTSTDSGKDLADATFVVLRFEVHGTSKVKYYVDGALVATHASTNLPEDEALTPTICVRNDGAAANTMTVDYVLVVRER